MLLNRKRGGELQRLPLHLYQNVPEHQSYEEFNDAISQTEKILMKKFKRVVTRGKRDRGVPVLFTTDVQQHLKELIALRDNFVKKENIYLFPTLHHDTPITGYKVMQKHAKLSGAKNPEAITSTRLRKHLATMSQILELSPNDIEQLATFMGHTKDVHKQLMSEIFDKKSWAEPLQGDVSSTLASTSLNKMAQDEAKPEFPGCSKETPKKRKINIGGILNDFKMEMQKRDEEKKRRLEEKNRKREESGIKKERRHREKMKLKKEVLNIKKKY
ncbi:hypothetical protein JTB14_015061 [Gonioctena quinquepunctata]|nr:hypothetical protein JTB14_015061 [Gonioctena quinquepunctata]